MRAEVDSGDPVNWGSSLNQGLVSWWKALPDQQRGNVFRDLCGHNHGALTNGPLWSGLSHPGGWGSLSFDGSDDYVEITSIAALSPAQASVAFWVRIDKEGTQELVTKDDGGSNRSYTTDFFGGNIRWYINGGGGGVVTSTTSPAVGTFLHVVGSHTGSAMSISINGKQEASGAASAANVNAQPWYIGRRGDGFYTQGLFDDVRIWNRGLSADEATQVYLESLAGDPNTLNWQRRLTYFDIGAAPGGGTILPQILQNGLFVGRAA